MMFMKKSSPISQFKTLIFAIALSSLTFISSSVFAEATTTSNTRIDLESKPVIAIAGPEELDFGKLTPTLEGVFKTSALDVLISTNAVKGYELYFSSKDDTTHMKQELYPADETSIIASTFTDPKTPETMPANSWGYSLNNTDFNQIPKKASEKQIKNITTLPTSADLKTTIHFGVKIDTTISSGRYFADILFTAIAHENPIPPKGIFTISTMQQMSTDICSATTTPKKESTTLDTDGSHHGDPNYVPTKTLTDTRDNNTYTVSKLADGKCWMTQNLRIINKTITPADSDVTSNYTIPASNLSGFDNYDTSNAYVDNTYGGYYTWYTATAGTGTQSLSTEGYNTAVSICPKGWRLPTSRNSTSDFQILYNNYNSSSALRSSPVNLTLSGFVYSSSMSNQGSDGWCWSSTVYSSSYAYNLGLNSSGVLPSNFSDKYYGFSVRCVAR